MAVLRGKGLFLMSEVPLYFCRRRYRCRANMAHGRESRPDCCLVIQVKIITHAPPSQRLEANLGICVTLKALDLSNNRLRRVSQTPTPKPETLNPKPETLNPKPETRNPKPSTLNPKPSTLNPKP
jgi:hypothetical protein